MLLAVSCSTETPERQTKTYSPSTEREFEAIEKRDTHAAPTYQNKSPSKLNPRPNPPKEKIAAPAEIAKPAPSTEIAPNDKLSAKNQERLQEINQNLAFFCMKHRKDPAFQDEDKCLSFTKKVLLSCEKKHQIINTVMVNCIKDRLKKKR